jgi:hypothetical protein
MASAVDAVRKGEVGYLKASKPYGMPQTTLERLAKKRNIIVPALAVQIPLDRRPTLPQDIEDDLKQYIVFKEQCLFGLKIIQVLELAFQIAEKMEFHITLTKMRNVLVKIG